jgi:polysaccharide chain length determinant protein (PEP-CTERM system associated)
LNEIRIGQKEDCMTERELTLADYLAMLRRRWMLIVVLALAGGPLAYGVSRFLPDRYKSQTLVLVERPSVPERIVQSLDTEDLSQRLSSMQQQILSRSRLEPIITQFGLYSSDVNKIPMEDLVGRLQKAIEVNPILPMAETQSRQLPGFYVNVTMGNPRTAQQVCTAVTSMFIEENLRQRQEHSANTTDFLVSQLAEAKTNLDEQDAKLAAFKSHYLGSLPDQEKMNLDLLGNQSSQLEAATQALARAQQDKFLAESMLTQQVAAWQATQTGRSPETLEQQLSAMQTQLASLQSRYTDDYPDVIKTKNDIAALKKQIALNANQKAATDGSNTQKNALEPPQIAQLRAQVHNLDQVIAEKAKEQERIKQQIKLYQDRVQSSPAVEQQFKELTRGYQTALDSYNDLQKKRNEAEMYADLQRKQQGEQFRVLDPANLPDKPSFPNRPLFAAGGLGGGLALGLGIAFLLEMKDSSLKTERDVEFALRLPVLAMIPEIEPAPAENAMRKEEPVLVGVGAGSGKSE